jgi:hypothetical protein
MELRRAILGLLLAVLSLPVPARAEKDWFASLYTNEGIELRADERLFVLYAALNAMGYDEAPVVRRLPVPSREMDPVRLALREQVKLDPALVTRLAAFFDGHPESAEAYARYVLTLNGPGGFEAPAGSKSSLKGIEALLAEVYSSQKLGEAFGRAQAEYRSALKSYHPVIDAPVAETRRLLKMKEDEPPRVVLAVNLFDARGKAFSGLVGEELFVVLGPSKEPDLFAVAREVARARLAPVVAAKVAGSKPIAEAAAAAQADNAASFATECFARAFAAAAVKLPPEKLDALASQGCRSVADLAGLVPGFASSEASLESFVGESLSLLTKEGSKPAAGKSGRLVKYGK